MVEEDEFLKELEREFYGESESTLQFLEENFLSFETTGDVNTIDEVNKALHSMKGSAQAVDLEMLGSFLHKFETYVQENYSGDRKIFVSDCLSYTDRLKEYIQHLSDGQEVSEDEAKLSRVKLAA